MRDDYCREMEPECQCNTCKKNVHACCVARHGDACPIAECPDYQKEEPN